MFEGVVVLFHVMYRRHWSLFEGHRTESVNRLMECARKTHMIDQIKSPGSRESIESKEHVEGVTLDTESADSSPRGRHGAPGLPTVTADGSSVAMAPTQMASRPG